MMLCNINILNIIFSKSYLVLTNKDTILKINDKIEFQKQINFDLNSELLKALNKKKDEFSNQFQLDYLNEVIHDHNKSRFKFLYFLNWGKGFFLIASHINVFIFFFKIFLKGVKLNLYSFNYLEKNKNDLIKCVGFPNHAFNYTIQNDKSNSFVEFLLHKKILKKNSTILSFDEYIRPSKIYDHNNLEKNSNQLKREKIKRKIKIIYIFKIPFILLQVFKKYFILSSKKSFCSFFYYYYKFSQGTLIKSLLGNLKDEKLFINSFYDVGHLKYEKDFKGLYFFNYSQNIFIPPSQSIIKNIFNPNFDLSLNLALEEISSINLSMFSHNQINIFEHVKLIDNVKDKIKEEFGISLLKTKDKIYKGNCNLGFENEIKINLKQDQINILIFDLPPESFCKTLKRNFTGDYFCNEDYLLKFYGEIIGLVKDLNVEVFIKPKYSVGQKRIKEYYNKISLMFLSNKISHYFLDPYGKIKLINTKFDIQINLPFTSTFLTQNLGKKNFFYSPFEYFSFEKELSVNLISKKNLTTILKS